MAPQKRNLRTGGLLVISEMTQKNIPADSITIGRLSYLAQVGVDTVRYYERSGLLEPKRRTETGYRLYSQSTIARIKFICRARTIGLSLPQIQTILQLHDKGGKSSEVHQFAAEMIPEIDEKIHGLHKWRTLLQRLAETSGEPGDKDIDGSVFRALMRGQCDKLSH